MPQRKWIYIPNNKTKDNTWNKGNKEKNKN